MNVLWIMNVNWRISEAKVPGDIKRQTMLGLRRITDNFCRTRIEKNSCFRDVEMINVIVCHDLFNLCLEIFRHMNWLKHENKFSKFLQWISAIFITVVCDNFNVRLMFTTTTFCLFNSINTGYQYFLPDNSSKDLLKILILHTNLLSLNFVVIS